MMKLSLTVTVAALAAIFLVAFASAAKPITDSNEPLVFSAPPTSVSGGPVEQQSPIRTDWQSYCSSTPSACVFNPTPDCLWTVDSRVIQMGYGTLDARSSADATNCLIADWAQHIVGVIVTSDTPDLVVTVTYQPQNVTFQFVPRLVSRAYEYRGCVGGPFYSGRNGGTWDPQLQTIPDSNGGVGIRTEITVSVRNPAGRRLRHIGAQLEIGSSAGPRHVKYCQSGADPGEPFLAGDAIWQASL